MPGVLQNVRIFDGTDENLNRARSGRPSASVSSTSTDSNPVAPVGIHREIGNNAHDLRLVRFDRDLTVSSVGHCSLPQVEVFKNRDCLVAA